jgi:FkbM family methyltransferase
MIEKFDVYTRSVFAMCINGISLIDMSGPRFHRLKGFGEIPFLFPSHAEPYETTSDYLEFAALRQGEIVLDIGAYSAVTSIIFAQAVGAKGRVYAFEPDDVNFECARINAEMAKSVMALDNITLINKAVWSDGKGVLFSHEGGMGSSAVAITGKNRGHERRVSTISIQDFVRENGLSNVDFVKVDVEGCEIELLEASASFLKSIGARLIVEPHSINGVLSTERCRVVLEAVGYRVHVRAEVGESEALIEATP